MIDIMLWIIFGALAGWIASMVVGTDDQQDALSNIVVGIIGAFLGGLVIRAIGGSDVSDFSFGSLLVAIMGAVGLLYGLRLIRHT